jgi:DNA-binding Lrp family transcriptional regulator
MKISEVSLDATDLQILRLLQDEGRLSNARWPSA